MKKVTLFVFAGLISASPLFAASFSQAISCVNVEKKISFEVELNGNGSGVGQVFASLSVNGTALVLKNITHRLYKDMADALVSRKISWDGGLVSILDNGDQDYANVDSRPNGTLRAVDNQGKKIEAMMECESSTVWNYGR